MEIVLGTILAVTATALITGLIDWAIIELIFKIVHKAR